MSVCLMTSAERRLDAASCGLTGGASALLVTRLTHGYPISLAVIIVMFVLGVVLALISSIVGDRQRAKRVAR